MRKLLFSVLGITLLIATISAPAPACPAVPVSSAEHSAGPVVRADYQDHRYQHRNWDEPSYHWHNYA